MRGIWDTLVRLAEILDPINSLIGLVTTLIAGFTAFLVWREGRRARKWWQEIRRTPGERPAIFVLDLLPGQDIRAQVENFRQQDGILKEIPDDRIVYVTYREKLLPDHMLNFHKDLQEKINLLGNAGADRIHLFLASPQPAAAAAGAALANKAVTLYHYDRDKGTYVNYGPLRI